MKAVTFFSKESELSELTGLNHEQLWDAEFNLDDWDFGFVSDTEFDMWNSNYEFFMLSRMESYCVGYEHVEYDGKHYYMVYHS